MLIRKLDWKSTVFLVVSKKLSRKASLIFLELSKLSPSNNTFPKNIPETLQKCVTFKDESQNSPIP
jgi:hypothetical protein